MMNIAGLNTNKNSWLKLSFLGGLENEAKIQIIICKKEMQIVTSSISMGPIHTYSASSKLSLSCDP